MKAAYRSVKIIKAPVRFLGAKRFPRHGAHGSVYTVHMVCWIFVFCFSPNHFVCVGLPLRKLRKKVQTDLTAAAAADASLAVRLAMSASGATPQYLYRNDARCINVREGHPWQASTAPTILCGAIIRSFAPTMHGRPAATPPNG